MKKWILSAAFFAPALFAFDATIPVLHLPDYRNEETRGDFLMKLEEAVHNVGFFALTGTGVDLDMLNLAYDQSVSFFAHDREEKMQFLSQDGQRGYVPGESAKGEKRIDCKEFFHVGRSLPEEDLKRLHYVGNVWPTFQPEFRSSMEALFSVLDVYKSEIGRALSQALGNDPSYFPEMLAEGECLMRVIHYPANPPKDAIWAGAHTDINFFTILPRSTAQGLQVLNTEGKWVDVIVPDDSFIINCGDMLENLSNGYARSATHRVVDPGFGQERYSIVFFVHPRSEDRLDPLAHLVEKTGGVRKYALVNRIELLAERLIDLGLASRGLMDFFVNSGAIDRLKEVGRFSPKAKETLEKAGYTDL